MGLADDEIADLALDDDEEGVWEENVAAVEAFLSVSTQWRVAVGQTGMIALGLDYAAARVGLDLAGIDVSPGLWSNIQAIEFGAFAALNGGKRHDDACQPSPRCAGRQGGEAEIDAVAASVRKVGDAAQDTGRRTTAGAASVDDLGRAADRATTEVLGLDAAQRATANSTAVLARNQQLAAGSTGNLVAQFNDIGMMLAAGQNPLQLGHPAGLADHAGDWTHGCGRGGKGPWVRLRRDALADQLITIGAIAVGAAMIQWLTGAGEKAVQLSDLCRKVLTRSTPSRLRPSGPAPRPAS